MHAKPYSAAADLHRLTTQHMRGTTHNTHRKDQR